MARKGSDFAGVSVAIVTPFLDGAVDYSKLKEQVEFQIEAGVQCLVPVGTTGESPTLSHEEHRKVISEVIEINAGRLKIMAGTGSNSTAETISLTQWAEKEGADAALIVAPYYNKPTQEGFYQHYKTLAESTSLPICVYNIPGRTGKNIEPETIIRLAEIDNITMVKEATGSMDQASQILGTTNLTVLSGDDSMTLPCSPSAEKESSRLQPISFLETCWLWSLPIIPVIWRPLLPLITSCSHSVVTCWDWRPIPFHLKRP